MTPGDVARLLAKAAAFDQRTVGAADVAAWHEALADLPAADAMDAVTAHYREHEHRLMPAQVRRLALDLARRRAGAARRRQLGAQRAVESAGTTDRTADVIQLVDALKARLGTGDPTVLRRREWVVAEERRQRQARPDAVPNPHYDPQRAAELAARTYEDLA